jgi:hypothetical protein
LEDSAQGLFKRQLAAVETVVLGDHDTSRRHPRHEGVR